MLKILHTGDIHLDSPFARMDAKKAQQRREEARASFCAMLAYARKTGVDLILMAGDVFDGEYVSRETTEMLVREFAKLSCPVVISPGNHDYYSPSGIWGKLRFPENVFIFRTPEVTKFSFDSLHTDVYGYAFTEAEMLQSPLSGQRVQDPSRINLLCAHGDTTSPLSRYAPLSCGEIAAFGADYAALGHIHNAPSVDRREKTVSVYCGCLEGRAPDETGPKGAVIAEITKEGTTAAVRAGRIRFSKRRYENAQTDCTGADSLAALESRIRQTVADGGYGEDTLLRLTLTGEVDPLLAVDTEALQQRFPELFSLEITDGTTPALSAAELMNDRTVRGEFYRALLPAIESGDPHKRRIAVEALRLGLAAMSGDRH